MGIILGYISTLGVYFCIYNIFAFGLNIQFGYTGILDFTVITFMAMGGYMAGVASLGPEQPGSGIYYVLGLIASRRLRSDYLAIVTLAAGSIVLGLCGVIMAICWLVANRIYRSTFGRTMRAIREDLDVAEAYGKHTFRVRMTAMVTGCIFVGIGGVLTIWFITALAPAGWGTSETFVVWAALIVGGCGNNLGAVVGSFLVAVLLNEATRFLPAIPAFPSLVSEIRNMCIGGLVILTLWFRPQGVVGERKARFFEVPLRTESREQVRVPAVVASGS